MLLMNCYIRNKFCLNQQFFLFLFFLLLMYFLNFFIENVCLSNPPPFPQILCVCVGGGGGGGGRGDVQARVVYLSE